jgi:hypothetical protein
MRRNKNYEEEEGKKINKEGELGTNQNSRRSACACFYER